MKQKSINSSRLIQILSLIKENELKTLHSFLCSPYHNSRQDVLSLFEFLLDHYPKFSKEIFRKDISQNIYGTTGKALSGKADTKVRNLMSRLMSLVESFLILEKQKGRNIQNRRLLIDSLMERKNYKLAYQKLNTLKQEQEKAQTRNTQYYFANYLLEEANFFLNVLTRQRSSETTVGPVLDRFQSYWLCNLLIYFCAMMNEQQASEHKIEPKFGNHIRSFVAETLDDHPQIIQTYFHILETLFNSGADEHFRAALLLVSNHNEHFTFVDRRHIYSFLLNFCAAKIRVGDSSYRQYRYEIYQQCLQQKLWITNAYLPAHHYALHINNMLNLKKFEETKAFISSATPTIPPQYREPISNLCLAMTAFYEGKLEESHDFLLNIERLDDFLYVLFQKVLTIQLFIVKKEFPLAQSSIQSLHAYLSPKRKKNLSTTVVSGFRNFAHFSKRLLNYQLIAEYDSRSPQILQKLHTEILASPSLYEREWLIEMTN